MLSGFNGKLLFLILVLVIFFHNLSFSVYTFLSDYLTDLYTGKSKKNCPQLGLKPGPLDLRANALLTELGRNLLGRRFLK